MRGADNTQVTVGPRLFGGDVASPVPGALGGLSELARPTGPTVARPWQAAAVEYDLIETDGVPIRAWVHGVQLEAAACRQLENVAKLPIVFHHVAAMPDVHWGIGATVGSVIATDGAIIPAAVGVDIGCGMMAVETSLTASDLRQNPTALRLPKEAINQVDPVSANLRSLMMMSAGSFDIEKKDGIESVILATSSEASEMIDNTEAERLRRENLNSFTPSGKKQPLIVRLSGKFKTAFPNGKPKAGEPKAP